MPYKNKEDQKACAKRHYERNSDAIKARAIAQKRINVPKNRQIVWDYLKQNPCVDCGETDPIVLEFDHIESKSKIIDISTMVNSNSSTKTVLSEIEKCEVRCANCHRRRTAIQFNWHSKVIK